MKMPALVTKAVLTLALWAKEPRKLKEYHYSLYFHNAVLKT